MKKVIIPVLVCISLVIFILLLSSLDYKKQANQFLQESNIDTSIEKHVYLKLFPKPHFAISYIQNKKLELTNIELIPNILSLLKFNPIIDRIRIKSVSGYTNMQEVTVSDYEQIIDYLLTNFDQKIRSIVINECQLVNAQGHKLMTINDLTLTRDEDKSNIIGYIQDLGQVTALIVPEEKGKKIKIDIESEAYTLSLLQNCDDLHNLTNGNIKIAVNNFLQIIGRYKAASVTKEKYKDLPMNITSDITVDDKRIKFSNIKIDSSFMEGTGLIDFARTEDVSTSYSFNLAKMDLTAIHILDHLRYFSDANNERLINFKSGNGSFVVNISEVNLDNKEYINNFKLTANMDASKLIINNLSGDIKSGGQFQIDGNVEQNNIRTLFMGNILLQYSDLNNLLHFFNASNLATEKALPFALTGEVSATPIDLFINDITVRTNENEFKGYVSGKIIGSTPHIKTIMTVSAIDLDKNNYPIISPTLNALYNLMSNMKQQDYLNKFVPIRNINYAADFDISFSNLVILENKFDHVNLVGSLNPAKIDISSLYLNKNEEYLYLKANINTDALKPTISISMQDAQLTSLPLSSNFLLDVRNKLNDNYDLNKIILQLSGFCSSLKHNNLNIKNLMFSLNNESALFNIDSITGELFSGSFEVRGSVLLDPYTWNLVYGFNNIDLNKLFALIPWSVPNPMGLGSINGMITTNGNTIEKLLYNLYTKSSFITKNIKIANFSIDDFVTKVVDKNYDVDNLSTDIQEAITQGETEMSNLKGNVELSKGVITLSNLALNSKYTVATASVLANIYDGQLKFSSIFSLLLPQEEWLIDKKNGNYNNNVYRRVQRNSNSNVRQNNITNNNIVMIDINADGTLEQLNKTANVDKLRSSLLKRKVNINTPKISN